MSSKSDMATRRPVVPSEYMVNGAFAFWEIAAAMPERPAVVDAAGKTMTYGGLASLANRMSRLFASRGLQRGDVLAAVMTNEPGFLALSLATSQLGVYLLPMNWHLTSEELGYLLSNSEAKALVTSERSSAPALAAAQLVGLPAAALWSRCDLPGFNALESDLAQLSDAPLDSRYHCIPMFYTSGTTGLPKGVRRAVTDVDPETALASSLPWYMKLFDLTAGDGVHLVTAPLYHAAPHMRAMQSLHLGHRVVLMEKWLPEAMLERVQQYGVTSTQMAPIMFHRLLQLPASIRQRYRTDTLRNVIHAGAPCPSETKQQMINWLGPVLYEFYAATEGGGTSVDSTQWLERPGTVGQPYPGSVVRILDDDGNKLPRGEVGAIFISDETPFEYFKDPVKTAAARRGGSFTAGDYGYLDEDGWLFICDRRVDLILSGGVNIYPAEVEAVLMAHFSVSDAVVIGVPDEEWGQSVHAIVEPVDVAVDYELFRAELATWCENRLAKFKCPRKFSFGSLPRTDSGKLGRGKLREAYLAGQLTISG